MRCQYIPRLVVFFACLAWSPPVFGQVNPDSVRHRNDCRLAAQILTSGQPANRRTWALRLLPTCGAAGGVAIADALRSARAAQGWEPGLEEIVMLTSVLHDANIFAAAANVAADPSAGKAARIQAVRVLYYQLGRGRADPYESFLAGDEGLIYIGPSDYPYEVGAPVPGDAATRAAQVAATILSGTGVDPDLCAAARTLAREAAREIRN